jgi:uncharacterized membrane protein YczE
MDTATATVLFLMLPTAVGVVVVVASLVRVAMVVRVCPAARLITGELRPGTVLVAVVGLAYQAGLVLAEPAAADIYS